MSAFSNAKWVAVSQFARVGSQFANLFVLSRILPPYDYGLMAMASVITAFAFLLRDQGTSAAIIQKEQINHDLVNTVFWFNLTVGMIIGLVIIASAPFLADYFNQKELIGVLIVLSLTFPISGSTIAHQALIERDSGFKSLAKIDVIASTVAMTLAIITAFLGWGVYSLVLQSVLMAVITSLLVWRLSTWRPTKNPEWKQLKSLIPFTGNMTAYQLISYFAGNADSFLIGKLLGAAPLGVYSLASKIMGFPVQNITYPTIRALLPVMSRQQNNPEEMARLYLQALSMLAMISMPIMGFICVLRVPFVEVMLGQKWHDVADVLLWLSMVGMVQCVSYVYGVVLMARGEANRLLYLSVMSFLVHVYAFYLGSAEGVVGIARNYFFASLCVGIICMFYSGSKCKLSIYKTAQAILPQLLITVLVVFILGYVNSHILKANFVQLSLMFLLGFGLQCMLYMVFLKSQMSYLLAKISPKFKSA